jgi:hypothetical protein
VLLAGGVMLALYVFEAWGRCAVAQFDPRVVDALLTVLQATRRAVPARRVTAQSGQLYEK